MTKFDELKNQLLRRSKVQTEYDNLAEEYARLETHIANESALWPAQGPILPNVHAATIFAFLKAVFASTYISGTLLFLLIGLSSASDKSMLDIAMWPLFSIFMSLFWGTFLALPITVVASVVFLPFYSFAINRIPSNPITFMLTGTLIVFPTGWFLDWDVLWTSFYAIAGAIGGFFFTGSINCSQNANCPPHNPPIDACLF